MPTAKRILLASASALIMTALVVGCATPTPEVVERVVEQTVEVEKVVEVEKTVEVEKEVEV